MTSIKTSILPVEIDQSGEALPLPYWYYHRKRKQRNDLDISQRVEVIRLQNQGYTQSVIGKKLNISQSVVSRILQQASAVLAHSLVDPCNGSKRGRYGRSKYVDKALTKWFVLARSYDMPVSHYTLASKAKELATLLGYADFEPDSAWLCNWKQRNGVRVIKNKRQKGRTAKYETRTANQPDSDGTNLENYKPDDIYSASEIGIQISASPGVFSETAVTPTRLGVRQLTLLLACNQSGSDKRPLLVVGEESLKSPLVKLPCQYESGCYNSWITSDVFVDWILTLDKDMKKQNRHILLILEPSPIHPAEVQNDLSNVHVKFVNKDHVVQTLPCHEGISESLKSHCRREYVNMCNLQESVQISLLDILHVLNNAWLQVDTKIIRWSFLKAGLKTSIEDEMALIEKQANFERLLLSKEERDGLVDFHFEPKCYGMISANQICASISSVCEEDNAKGDDVTTVVNSSIRSNDKKATEAPVSSEDAIESLALLRLYMETEGLKDFRTFYQVEAQIQTEIGIKQREQQR